MLLIQVVAALLLLLGSGLIFKALAEIDAPTRPQPIMRPRRDHLDRSAPDVERLPRAA